MRKSRVIILLVLLAAAGVFAYRYYRRSTESPFAVGAARVGRSYASVDADLPTPAGTQRTCTAIVSGYRICRGRTDDPRGDITLVVNQRGRVVIVDQHVTEVSAESKQLTSDLTTRWTEVATPSPMKRADSLVAKRWTTDDNSSTATMTMKKGTTSLAEVLVTDDRALLRMDITTLPALLVLSREGLVSPTLLDAFERRAPGALAKAADRLAGPAQSLAAAAATLPDCAPRFALGIDPGQARRVALGNVPAEIVTQAAALLFPGKHLELRDSVYLVDGDNVPELIEVTDPVVLHNGDAWAFAVNYAGRADAVAQRTQTFDAPSCRASAEIVVAHLDRKHTRVASVERATVGSDALASRVLELRAAPEGDTPRLAIHTVGTYGATDWYGEVDWFDIATLDSLRLSDRYPITLAKADAESRVAAVDLEPYTAADRTGHRALGGKRVTAVVQARGGSTVQPLFLPSTSSGPASGWTMLTVL